MSDRGSSDGTPRGRPSGRPDRGSNPRPASGRPASGRPASGRPAAGRPVSGGPRREGDDRARPARDGDRRPPRDGDRPRGDRNTRDGDRRPPREELTPEELLRMELRPVRARHDDPVIAEGLEVSELHPSARNELKALAPENAEFVGQHLAMAARLIDVDPELAHLHAISASRRGGRIASVRETLGLTAYTIGDFALALRELRTFRRISGSFDQVALEVDCERGLERPDRALELGRSVDRSTLPDLAAANLAIAMSGARLDQGNAQLALAELEIPQLNPNTAFAYSPALFAAYAEVLAELGRTVEASEWLARANVAQQALDDAYGSPEEAEEFEVFTEYEEPAEASQKDAD